MTWADKYRPGGTETGAGKCGFNPGAGGADTLMGAGCGGMALISWFRGPGVIGGVFGIGSGFLVGSCIAVGF